MNIMQLRTDTLKGRTTDKQTLKYSTKASWSASSSINPPVQVSMMIKIAKNSIRTFNTFREKLSGTTSPSDFLLQPDGASQRR